MRFYKLILGIICSNLSTNVANINTISNDDFSYISKICEANNITYSNTSDSSYSIETDNQKTSYEFSNDNKLTKLDYFEKENSKRIQNTYSYNNSKLIYAVTNGQVFEKKNEIISDINIDSYYINNKLYETIKSNEVSITKEFSNGQEIQYLKNDNNILINNNLETTNLTIDDDGNVLQEYSNNYSIKNEYQDNNLISKEYDSFSYLKTDDKGTYKCNDKTSIDILEYTNENFNYIFDNKDTILVKDKDDYYSLDINKSNITYHFIETENDYKSRYIDKVYFDGNTLFSYQYDSNGNIIRETNLGNNIRYNYDTRGQIISYEDENNVYSYSYDNRGNIIEEIKNGNKSSYKYKEDQLTNLDDKTLTYDSFGNLTSFDNQEFTYKSGNKLSSYTDGNISSKYDYDSNGLRISKTTDDLKTEYFYVDNKLIYESNGSNLIRYFYDRNNEILGFEYNNNNYFYIKDSVNCIKKIIDFNGNILVNYSYDPWGNILSIDDISNNQLSKVNHIIYKGYFYDFESNLYYLISRYYSPVLHRFISIDNLEIISSRGTIDLNLNLYLYSDNNPIMKKDELGYCAATIIVGSCVISITSLLIYLVGIILICSTMIIVNEIVRTLKISGISTSAKNALEDSKAKLKKVIDELNSIAKNSIGAWMLSCWKWWDNTYRNQYEVHHIIAQSSIHHGAARYWLQHNYSRDINIDENLATIKKLLHKHLHTRYYYDTTTALLFPFSSGKEGEFFAVLASIKAGILAISEALPN